jgi:NAD(P)-dependent dehydrogenase (short-subunit alcohol dehydrogenase family)
MGSLEGKVAIVTGAGRGIGRGEALLLAAEGARVVVNDVDAEPARQVVDEIVTAGGEAVAHIGDIATWMGGEEVVSCALDTFGGMDVLVNNAGILRDGMCFNVTEDEWDDVIRVHLKGHFAPSRAAAIHWRGSTKAGRDVHGRIVNTTSESGLFGNPGQAGYSAAKAGIASMTTVLARELKKYGVTVNAVSPRSARTRMTEAVAGGGWLQSEAGEFDAADPENVAPVVAWLAGDDAADVSGQVLVIWGEHLSVLHGWHLVNLLSAGGKRWSIADLAAKKGDLFAPAERGSKIPAMGFGS